MPVQKICHSIIIKNDLFQHTKTTYMRNTNSQIMMSMQVLQNDNSYKTKFESPGKDK